MKLPDATVMLGEAKKELAGGVSVHYSYLPRQLRKMGGTICLANAHSRAEVFFPLLAAEPRSNPNMRILIKTLIAGAACAILYGCGGDGLAPLPTAFIGDSITEKWLVAPLVPGTINAAIGGETCEQMHARFQRDVLASAPPTAPNFSTGAGLYADLQTVIVQAHNLGLPTQLLGSSLRGRISSDCKSA
jgi:hypothetical protein